MAVFYLYAGYLNIKDEKFFAENIVAASYFKAKSLIDDLNKHLQKY